MIGNESIEGGYSLVRFLLPCNCGYGKLIRFIISVKPQSLV